MENHIENRLAKLNAGSQKEAIDDYTKVIEVHPKNSSAYRSHKIAKHYLNAPLATF